MRIEEAEIRWGLLALSVPAIVVGCVFSPALLSIGTIVTAIVGVLGFDRGLNPIWRARFPAFFRSSLFWGLVGLYLFLVASAPMTYDWSYYLERLRIKIPLLVLPIAWAGIPFWYATTGWGSALWRRRLLVGFVSLTLAGVLVYYGLHYAEVNGMIYRGQAMPVPRGNHIRFSLMVALASTAALDARWRFGSRWLPLVGALLLVGLHVLAVRSGIVAGYAGWAVVIGGRALARGNYRLLTAAAVALIVLPLAAYWAVPSFHTKMNYMRYELLQRDPQQDELEFSDEGRLTSVRFGLDLWREHPVFGVGPGNLLAASDSLYAVRIPGMKGKRPHNQFVSALAGGGMVGFAVTVICFLAIGFGGRQRRDPLFVAVWTIFFLSCLVENTLETSVGVSLFVFFLLLYGYPPYRKPG